MLVVSKTAYDYGDNTTTILKCFVNDSIGKQKAEKFIQEQKDQDLYEFNMNQKIQQFTIDFKNNHEITKFGSLAALHNPKDENDKNRKETFIKLCKQYTKDYAVAIKEYKNQLGVDENKSFSSLAVEYYNYDLEEVEVG